VRRRTCVSVIAAAPLAAALVPASSRAALPLLAMLSPASPHSEQVMRNVNTPFKQALTKLGYETGRSIDIAERFAEGDEARLPALAADLVALRPRVLFTHTGNAAAIAARATRTIPIVVGPAGEATLLELAGGSLARPTTNVTGFALGSVGLDDKCVLLLMELVPAAQRVGVLVNPRNPNQQRYPAELKGALAVRGKTLVRLESGGLADIDAALANASAKRVGAIFVVDDALIAGNDEVRQRIVRFATAARMPIASSNQDFARDSALLSMGASIPALAASAAGYVDKILRGAHPADLPIQLPTVLSVIVNRKVARALGLTIPASLLVRADEVIE